jgi:hypothetical protein
MAGATHLSCAATVAGQGAALVVQMHLEAHTPPNSGATQVSALQRRPSTANALAIVWHASALLAVPRRNSSPPPPGPAGPHLPRQLGQG